MRCKVQQSPIMDLSRRGMFPNYSKALETDSTDLHCETEQLRRKLQSAQEENLKLQAVITDLTQVNKRWQQYNNDRQIYVQKLLNKIQEQEDKISEQSIRNKQNYVDNTGSSSSIMSCESEVERLQHIEQTLKEKIGVLEFQLKTYKDDWEAELNEKKQAIQDKEVGEKKMTEVLAELQVLKKFVAAQEDVKRSQYFCHCCGQPCQPPTNRLYRTALHLPYSTNINNRRTTYVFEDDIVIDGPVSRNQTEENLSGSVNIKEIPDNSSSKIVNTDLNIKDFWQTKPDVKIHEEEKEMSYSRSSTVPLVSPVSQITSPSTELSKSDETIASCCSQGVTTVTSSVQIPISKSLSAPDGKANKVFIKPRKSVDSIKFSSSVTPPVSFISSTGINNCNTTLDGTDTQTMENIICPSCSLVFPPKFNVKFLDHFELCQTIKRD